jgi:hypothetical protein
MEGDVEGLEFLTAGTRKLRALPLASPFSETEFLPPGDQMLLHEVLALDSMIKELNIVSPAPAPAAAARVTGTSIPTTATASCHVSLVARRSSIRPTLDAVGRAPPSHLQSLLGEMKRGNVEMLKKLPPKERATVIRELNNLESLLAEINPDSRQSSHSA